ncbi:prepilin peptidase [Caldisericum exile]|uniref:Type 4 prepilin-like proteins leader peptide processing enzyme n=1 Tax=Caldisericum exile (strain DSM 21853 / NBRC 104410 / AZM16c01) TaxID=511051 RepID=A0A7U6GF36_CALEA|nr:A24 family peptidase [Caldisericum exile]BAL81191.1 type 4 prepilin-like proteins leader peptide processing enzyme [Caldisericum exile AZM16c01]
MENIILLFDHLKVFFAVLFFVLGAIIGSFLNVVIYRLPRHESLVFPQSHCPICGHRLSTLDLIPIFSYVALRGKCRYCGAKIPPIYPIVESLTAILFSLTYLKFGLTLLSLKYLIFISVLIVVSFIDLFEGVVFDIVVIPAAIIGLIFGVFGNLKDTILGIIFYAIIFFLIITLSKLFYKEGGMGEGDLTTGTMIGAFLGFKFGIVAFILSFVIGAIAGILIMLISKKGGKTEIPFVPYMSIASVLAIFFGNYIFAFYLNLF